MPLINFSLIINFTSSDKQKHESLITRDKQQAPKERHSHKHTKTFYGLPLFQSRQEIQQYPTVSNLTINIFYPIVLLEQSKTNSDQYLFPEFLMEQSLTYSDNTIITGIIKKQ